LLLLVAVAGCAPALGCAPVVKQEARPGPREVLQLRQQLAEALVRRRDHTSAAPILKDLVARQPRNARVHLLLGVVLREKGALDAAERELRRALELTPGSPDAHAALGALLLRRGRHAQAERAHRAAVAAAPGVARHHNDLGFCLLVQRRMKAARRELMEAVRLDPDLRVAFNNLGFLLGLEGDAEGAMRAFSQAGGRAMALTNMGYVEELRGRPAHARRYYERSLQIRRDYRPALHNLRALDPGRWGAVTGEGVDHEEERRAVQAAAGADGADDAGDHGQRPGGLHQGRAPGRVDGQVLQEGLRAAGPGRGTPQGDGVRGR
jgi:Flp pilus assembly protein TadD